MKTHLSNKQEALKNKWNAIFKENYARLRSAGYGSAEATEFKRCTKEVIQELIKQKKEN